MSNLEQISNDQFPQMQNNAAEACDDCVHAGCGFQIFASEELGEWQQ
jgi:hypothetical protein